MIASVEVSEIRPAATLVIWRSLSFEPTLTTLAGFPPAKLIVLPAKVMLGVLFGASVIDLEPKATASS